jgi:endonuclease-3 related protein
MQSKKAILKQIYYTLYNTFGPQHWWPGETKLEIIIGAILTQNTNWKNVEKAISNLKINKLLTLPALQRISSQKLAQLIRPSGYFNIKAQRLKEFLKFIYTEYHGSLSEMSKQNTMLLRKQLLDVKGVGPETADSILLYAFNKPIFVVDAYTKRIFSRHKIIKEKSTYIEIQELFMKNMSRNDKIFNEYHALIVKLGKDYCKKTPRCNTCPLQNLTHSIT